MDKIYGMIGLAKRAGKIVSGSNLCLDCIKKRRSFLIIISHDASDTTAKSLTDSCTYYGVRNVRFGTKGLLGKYTGGGERSVISVNDENFANVIYDKIRAAY